MKWSDGAWVHDAAIGPARLPHEPSAQTWTLEELRELDAEEEPPRRLK